MTKRRAGIATRRNSQSRRWSGIARFGPGTDLPSGATPAGPVATLALDNTVLNSIFAGKAKMSDVISQGQLKVTGDRQSVAALFGMLDSFSSGFNIVTPATQ